MYNTNWYKKRKQSKLTPPDYVFGIVWPILYLQLMVFFILLVKDMKCVGICPPIFPFLVQMVLNFSWSPVFFTLKKPKISLAIVIGMVLLTAYTLYLTLKINKKICFLLVPYLCWISFATYLNGYIAFHN